MFKHELGNDSLSLGEEPGLYIPSDVSIYGISKRTDRDEDIAITGFRVSSTD